MTHGRHFAPVDDDHCGYLDFHDRRSAVAGWEHVLPAKDNTRIPPVVDVGYSDCKDIGGYTESES